MGLARGKGESAARLALRRDVEAVLRAAGIRIISEQEAVDAAKLAGRSASAARPRNPVLATVPGTRHELSPALNQRSAQIVEPAKERRENFIKNRRNVV
jgi:hypothetical protein